jgi:hypothetical protein
MKKSQSKALTLFLFSARHQALLEWSDENKKTKSVRILSFFIFKMAEIGPL